MDKTRECDFCKKSDRDVRRYVHRGPDGNPVFFYDAHPGCYEKLCENEGEKEVKPC